MFRKILLISVCLLSNVCLAGQNYWGVKLKIVGIQDTITYKYFWVKTDSNPATALPTCHTGPADRVIWDLNDAASRAALSLALTAYAAGKKVDIDANDTCIEGLATVRNIYFSETQ